MRPPQRVLALSPHLDDAVFSVAVTLRRLALAGATVTIATAFTRSVPAPSGFALDCQLDKGLTADADYMALRRDEDREACRILELREPEWLDLPEAPHRGYASAAELFGALRIDDVIVPILADTMTSLLRRIGPDLILAPQAVGAHVDHRQVVLALDRVRAGVPVGWWRDFPYSARETEPDRPFSARFDGLQTRTVQGDAAEMALKTAAIAAYRTQVAFQFGAAERRERLMSAARLEEIALNDGAELAV